MLSEEDIVLLVHDFLRQSSKRVLLLIGTASEKLQQQIMLKIRDEKLCSLLIDFSQEVDLEAKFNTNTSSKTSILVIRNATLENPYIKFNLDSSQVKMIIICDRSLLHPILDPSIYFAPIIKNKVQKKLLSVIHLPFINKQEKSEVQEMPQKKSLPNPEKHNNLRSYYLNKYLMTADHSMMQFLADRVKVDRVYEAFLFELILLSRDDEQMQIAAANAMTILNAGRVHFSHRDFRDIQIPGADLTGAICYQTDFRGANLKGVRFHKAFLKEANLENADVSSAQFGELPFIKTPSDVTTLAFHQDYKTTSAQELFLRGSSRAMFYDMAELIFARCTGTLEIPPDTYITAGCRDGRMYQFHLETGQSMGEFGHGYRLINSLLSHDKPISSFAISPQRHLIASAGLNTSIELWLMGSNWLGANLMGEGNRFLKQLPKEEDYRKPRDIKFLAFDSTGNNLASCDESEICLWERLADEPQRIYHRADCIVFNPKGVYFATADRIDHTASIWNYYTRQRVRIFKGHSEGVTYVAFDPKGKRLATASNDKTICVWDVYYGQILFRLEGHTGWVVCVTFHPDGQRVASGSWDQSVRLWDIITGQCLQIYLLNSPVEAVQFHPNGKYLATASKFDKAIRFWEISNNKQLHLASEHAGDFNCVAFHPSGERYVTGGGSSSIFDLIPSDKPNKNYNTVCVWNTTTGLCLDEMRGHTGRVECVVYHPDGTQIASGSGDCTIRLWDLSKRQVRTLRAHKGSVIKVAFDSEGRFLASSSSSSEDSTLRIWDANTGQLLQTLPRHTQSFPCAVLNSSGNQEALFNGKKARFWDEPIVPFQENIQLNCIALHPEGKVVATGHSHAFQLWEVKAGKWLQTVPLWYEVRNLAFSCNSLLCVVGAADYLTIWELVAAKKFILRRSAKMCPQLYLEETNISQTFGLSDQQQQLFSQHGAKGQPALATQSYQSWCSLFRSAQHNLNSTSSSFSFISTSCSRLKITREEWVITVVRKINENPNASSNYFSWSSAVQSSVFFLIEGIHTNGHFMIHAELKLLDKNEVMVELKRVENIQRFQEGSNQYECNQWNITLNDGMTLLKNIQADRQSCLSRQTTKNSSIFSIFNSSSIGGEFNSCPSWCENHLKFIGANYPLQWHPLTVITQYNWDLPQTNYFVP